MEKSLLKYNNKGRCRKCNHKLIAVSQSGPVPPRSMCPVCSYTDWSKVFFLSKNSSN